MNQLLFLNKTLPTTIIDNAKKIKLLAIDCDGVLTSGHISYLTSGEEIKSFHVQDGLGLQLLQKIGIKTAIITGRESNALTIRAKELGIDYLYQKEKDKLSCLRALAESLSLSCEEVAFVGDDLPDLPAILWCGLGIAVANAHPLVAQKADITTHLSGGKGAVREVCDFILSATDSLKSIIDAITNGKEYFISK